MNELIIRAGILIDGLSDTPRYDMAILVIDGLIEAVTPWSGATEGMEVMDCAGQTVMPGLINAHVHLGMQPYATDPPHEMPFAFSVLIERQLKTLLHSGVTLIRNQGTADFYDLYAKQAVDAGLIDGPDILTCGPVLTTPDGHGRQMGVVCQGVEDCAHRAQGIAERGVDTLKLIATGGMMTQGTSLDAAPYSVQELRVMVEVAAARGLISSVHAHGAVGMRNAVQAGVTTVEHGTFLEDDILEEMLLRGTWLCPTLTAPHSIKTFGREGGLPEEMMQKMDRAYGIRMASFDKAYRAGVKIGLGTDAGTPNNPFDKTWFELKMMVDHGVSEMAALQIATARTAEMLQMPKHGAITSGRYANLLVLAGNPLEEITALKAPVKVIKKGMVYR